MDVDPTHSRLGAETTQSPEGWLSRNAKRRSSANKSRNGISEPPSMRRATKRIKLNINSKDFRVREGDDVDLRKWPTNVAPTYKWKDQYQRLLREHVAQLSSQQQLLYASNRYAVLLIFQAMDAAGKDGAIKHVMSGVNPQGCQVFSSKRPNPIEFQHDFLWRSVRDLPERGRIGIFNRSYYEEVLIARVHPEILHGEGLADAAARRQCDMARPLPLDYEFGETPPRQRHPHHQDFSSPLQGRTAPAAFGTHRPAGKELEIQQRRHYREKILEAVYEGLRCLPQRDKHPKRALVCRPRRRQGNARLIASKIVLDTLEGLKLAYPRTTPNRRRELLSIRKQLTR